MNLANNATTRCAALISLAGLACFVVMSFLASTHDRFPGDLWLARQFQTLNSGLLVEPMYWAERLVEWPYWGIIGALAATAGVLLAGVRAVPVIALALLSRELVPFLKDIIGRPRPSSDLVSVTESKQDYSFPGGHAFNGVVLFGLIFYLATFYVSNRRLRLPVQALCLWVVVAVGLARVHAGLHWPSDVVGGLLLGLLVVALLIMVGELLPGGRLARARR